MRWNLVAPELIQAAVRRGEGELADMGPFVAVTTPHTGRSPNDKFVVKEPSSEKDVDWGKVNQADDRGAVRGAARGPCSVSQRARRTLRAGFVLRRAHRAPLSVRYVSPNAWHMAFVRNMFIRPELAELATFEPNFTVLHAPELQADPATARHAHRHVHRAQSRRAHDPHRRHALRRRAEEGDVHRDELPAAEAGRAVDALLRERRRQGRHRALLRALRHRQDDALGRSRARAHRRRRARLVRRRSLQLRGRLLREGDQPLARERARHLSDHADVRHGARERRARPQPPRE